MKPSTLKSAVAAAICAVGCVSFAQTSNDTNSSGTIGNNPSANPQNTAPAGTDRSSVPDTQSAKPATDSSGNRDCSGITDRQAARACREGLRNQRSNQPYAPESDQGGRTDYYIGG